MTIDFSGNTDAAGGSNERIMITSQQPTPGLVSARKIVARIIVTFERRIIFMRKDVFDQHAKFNQQQNQTNLFALIDAIAVDQTYFVFKF